MLRNGKTDEARAIATEIAPWLSRLRFYPTPAETPLEVSAFGHGGTLCTWLTPPCLRIPFSQGLAAGVRRHRRRLPRVDGDRGAVVRQRRHSAGGPAVCPLRGLRGNRDCLREQVDESGHPRWFLPHFSLLRAPILFANLLRFHRSRRGPPNDQLAKSARRSFIRFLSRMPWTPPPPPRLDCLRSGFRWSGRRSRCLPRRWPAITALSWLSATRPPTAGPMRITRAARQARPAVGLASSTRKAGMNAPPTWWLGPRAWFR